jgi:aspartate aminotransferase
MLTQRIKRLKPSPTLALAAKAKELAASGTSIIDLTLGEPDFDTPTNISQAGLEAIQSGFTHYTATPGILKLRQAVAKKLLTDNHLIYSPSEVIVGVGSKQLLYHAFQVLCQHQDQVLVPTPTWSTYVEQIKLANATPVLIPLKPPFKLQAKNLIPHLTPQTKVLILNSPSNPTGAVIDSLELEKIARLVVKHQLFVISDEIYEKLIFSGQHQSIASINSQTKARTITINGFSKAYAMTGWRIGYAAGPENIISAMSAIQSQTTSNTSSISQMAALEALSGSQYTVTTMRRAFSQRRDYLTRHLKPIRGTQLIPPEGGIYYFINVRPVDNSTGYSSSQICEQLLIKASVASIPGEAFYAPGFIRLALTAPLPSLKQAVSRINQFFTSL